ncbi:hypothetical protein [Natronoarchaeum mannanilyticum]|uniref:Tat (Twin-arginine translocation) pathway signal sequence n=2 Tax=Natronoarchaeum mannanilyticum TaxID=926360 RepID=A0AAV3T6Z6_9EURY
MPDLSRRKLLRRSGAALGVGALAASSGTATVAPDTALAPDREPTYRRWLPAGRTFRDADDYFVRYVDVAAIRAHDDVSAGEARRLGNALGSPDHLGIPQGSVEEVIQAGLSLGGVVLGTFDAGTVVETLPGSSYERTDEYAGYEQFEGTFGQRVAVRDGVVVWASEQLSGEYVEATIDARNGDASRYHEDSDAFAALTERIGRPTMFTTSAGERAITRGRHTNATGHALLWLLDGDDAHRTQLLQFSDAEAAASVDRSTFRRGSLGGAFSPLNTAVSRNGRAVRLDGTVDAAEFAERAADGATPSVTWAVDHDSDADEATVEHVAGDAVGAERVTLETLDGETERQFADEYGTVEPGDAVTVAYDPATDGALRIEVGDESAVYTRRFDPGE